MKTYGKWEPAYDWVFRTVAREHWPFGFHWKRVTREWRECPRGQEDRLCRVLNGEPEPVPPEVKLSDPLWKVTHQGQFLAQSGYRFSTEALKAELARRDAETPWYLSERDRRSGTDRRKPAKPAKKGRGK